MNEHCTRDADRSAEQRKSDVVASAEFEALKAHSGARKMHFEERAFVLVRTHCDATTVGRNDALGDV